MTGPSGTATFLFTDIEGSTRSWEQAPDAMRGALERHDEILRDSIARHGGYVFATGGDGFAVAFGRADEAVAAALEAQAALAAQMWPAQTPILVRMGLHTGSAAERDGSYFGPTVNAASRLMAAAHGGQVVCSAITADLIGNGVMLTDLGEHRLRDLSAAQRIFQVGAGAFAPLISLATYPGNLVPAPSSFIGRSAELTGVADGLRSSRLVTITGVGGVGKTRLAARVAAELLPEFAQGAWMCELAAGSSSVELAQIVALALGVLQRPQMTMEQSIVDFLRPRTLLLILDNCEHLLDAAADLIAAVLAGAPSVHVLATSREGLGVAGERVWPLRSLPLASTVDTAAASDAVMLFVERARAVVPDFSLDPATSRAVVDVCRRLDGIPLAIELAAARVPSMSPAEIASHLDERFRLLTGGRRRAVERHQTLRATVEWSYSLLTEAERTVFSRLGVFPASFDEPAAVAVGGGDDLDRWDVIDALANLVAKSMLGVDHSAVMTRYQLLETLRYYARDNLDASAPIDEIRHRHTAYYAGFAEMGGHQLIGPHELEWRPRMAAELDNLRTAVGWALDAPDPSEMDLGFRIAGALLDQVTVHPSWGIQAWLRPALAGAGALSTKHRALVLAVNAYDAYVVGDLDAAVCLGHRVCELGASAPDMAVIVGFTAETLAIVRQGRPDEAFAVVPDVLAGLESAGASPWPMLGLHSVAGWLAFYAGDLNSARAHSDTAIDLAERIHNPSAMACALAIYGRAYADHDLTSALDAVNECIRLVRAGAGDGTYSGALQTAAMLQIRRGQLADAAQAVRAALAHEADAGNRFTVGANAVYAVLVLAADPQHTKAAAVLTGAVEGLALGGLVSGFIAGLTKDLYDQAFRTIEESLGDAAVTSFRHEGSVMAYDEVVSYTLSQLEDLPDRAAMEQR